MRAFGRGKIGGDIKYIIGYPYIFKMSGRRKEEKKKKK